jgi:sulfopyruvate decarboxylase subunit alpha
MPFTDEDPSPTSNVAPDRLGRQSFDSASSAGSYSPRDAPISHPRGDPGRDPSSGLGIFRPEPPVVMPVSYENSKIVYEGIRAAGVRSLSALPETWLGLLLQRAEDDPEMSLVQVAKEEEAIGVAAGAYLAGEPHILLMQNHGFLAAINGIVSLAQLYGIPLCMMIALRGHWGEPYPWHTRGGIVTEEVLRALGIPFEYARDVNTVQRQIREAHTFSQSSLSPVALLLTRDLMED